MRIFIYGASDIEALTLSLGVIFTILAVVFTYFANRHADRWFLLKNPEQAAEFIQ